MARIVIAGTSEASRAQLSRLLASSGYEVFKICSSGSSLRRTLAGGDGDIVVLFGMLADVLPDALAEDFGDSALFLLIARPEMLDRCESDKVFKLAYPCSGSAVTGALEMLTQLHDMRMPRRKGNEKAVVEKAKQLLMEQFEIDEPAAHRRMQQYAMSHGVKMMDYAQMLLQGRNDDA